MEDVNGFRQKKAILELNIKFVIRAEPFTLEQTNELCTRIWLVYKQWNLVGLRHDLHMRRTVQQSL